MQKTFAPPAQSKLLPISAPTPVALSSRKAAHIMVSQVKVQSKLVRLTNLIILANMVVINYSAILLPR